MKRTLILAAALAMLATGAACGDGGGEPKTAPTSTPAADVVNRTVADVDEPEATPGSTREARGTGSPLDSILPAVFEQALAGSPGEPLGAGLEPGDPALLAFLPDDADLPAGYESMGEFAFRAPDGISETGTGDIAMMLASRGDPDDPDPAAAGALIAMVMRFDDLQDLEDAFGGVSPEDFEDALAGNAGLDGVDFIDIESLETDGLGEDALGVSFTIDMSAFFEALIDSFGVDGELPPEAGDLSSFTRLNMRMYLFGRGDLAAGIVRLGFGDSLDDGVDELALARLLDAKLSAAD